MFVNRNSELARLDAWWRAPESRLGVVWGRRRVGKTSLIRRFAADVPAVFHTGAGRPPRAELAMLARQVGAHGRFHGTRDLESRPFVDWDDALDHLAALASDEPLLVVLDEFPELAATVPELPNLLRAFLERADGRTNLKLLLCGSAARYMAALGEERQPLYGRADLQIVVHPFRPWEAALMLPDLRPAERALVYGLVGGVPLYLSWWDQGGSVEENLETLACQPGARLLLEGDLVLATEVESGEYPSAVLHAIAAGKTRHTEIKNAIGAEPARTLDRLSAVRLVSKVQPVTEGPGTRQRRYRIVDNFVGFYLAILSRFRGEIDAGLGPTILPVLLECLDDHLGMAWEEAFRSHLVRLAAAAEFGEDVVGIGPWWTRDHSVEVDAVAVRGRSRVPFLAGEAKWAKTVDGKRVAAALSRKAAQVPAMVDDPLLVVAGREKVDGMPSGTHVVTAAEIFA